MKIKIEKRIKSKRRSKSRSQVAALYI